MSSYHRDFAIGTLERIRAAVAKLYKTRPPPTGPLDVVAVLPPHAFDAVLEQCRDLARQNGEPFLRYLTPVGEVLIFRGSRYDLHPAIMEIDQRWTP